MGNAPAKKKTRPAPAAEPSYIDKVKSAFFANWAEIKYDHFISNIILLAIAIIGLMWVVFASKSSNLRTKTIVITDKPPIEFELDIDCKLYEDLIATLELKEGSTHETEHKPR